MPPARASGAVDDESGLAGTGAVRGEHLSSLSLALRQRNRSYSSASSSKHDNSSNSPQRMRTSTGSTPSPWDGQNASSTRHTSVRHSPSTSSSSRFVTSSSDFHLPQRVTTPTFAHSPTFTSGLTTPSATSMLAAAAAGAASPEDALTASSSNALPLLRRKAAAAALVHASRRGLRRGSMLGKEVANDAEKQHSSEGDEDMDPKKHYSPDLSTTADDEEENMQIDTGDVTVSGVESEGKTARSSSPTNKVSQGNRSQVTMSSRRAAQRRATHVPKDRGVLRVAASLRDETRPAEGEIASEAKLQRRLGPESDSMAPTTPKLLARRSQSPFGPSSGGLLDRTAEGGGDDFYYPGGGHFEMSDDSDYDGDVDLTVKTAGASMQRRDSTEAYETGIPIPGTESDLAQKEKLWLNFRDSGNPRLSPAIPGLERMGSSTASRSRGASVTPGAISGPIALSGSLGSALDQAMELEPLGNNGSSPSLWGRSAKRKVGDERFEPYFTSAMHKRRAVSPIALISAANNMAGQVRSGTPTSTLSPGLYGISQTSPLYIQGPYSSAIPVNLPTPTPLSIPSPTMSVSRGPALSASLPRSLPTLPASRAGMATASSNVSPSSTRPSTPTNMQQPPVMFGAGPSPSLLSTSASKAATGAGSNGNGGNGGSGPGYGSGALGLSLGGGSKRFKEEQEEMDEEEGMLGDVSAIKLGEL